MQEFLALNTDARIAFVKKPFIVSRIDKVGYLNISLNNTVPHFTISILYVFDNYNIHTVMQCCKHKIFHNNKKKWLDSYVLSI